MASPFGLAWLVDRLRQPDGCPWDREQDHLTLRPFLLEETYEVYDALEDGSTPDLAEELGDLLLQIVLHAQYAAEAGVFDLADVQRSITSKIDPPPPPRLRRRGGSDGRRRHAQLGAAQGRRARSGSRVTDRPRRPPAPEAGCRRHGRRDPACRPPSRASRGRCPHWRMPTRCRLAPPAWATTGRTSRASSTRSPRRPPSCWRPTDAEDRREEFGDLLFVMVNLGRKLGIDAEAALRSASRKFAARFARVERLADEQGLQLRALGLDALDELWQEAKREEAAGRERRSRQGGTMSIGGGLRYRADGRTPGQMRPVSIDLGVQKWAAASLIYRQGDTHVLCAATVEDRVPPHLRGKGTGWVTAEYAMLPAATSERMQRESMKGRPGGRTYEIQRLVGRALRGVVDTSAMGERTVTIDCDVLQADGGTRCASITGGYIALVLALRKVGLERAVTNKIAAISVGIVSATATAGPGVHGGLQRGGGLQRRGHRRRHLRRDPGHGRGQALRPGADGAPARARRWRPPEAVRHAGRGPRQPVSDGRTGRG